MSYYRRIGLLALLAFVSLSFGIGYATDQPKRAHQGEHAAGVHWGYSGEEGPEHWGSLKPEYALCAAGRRQSPIDIAGASARDLPNIVFRYQPESLRIINNGHTVEVNCDLSSSIEVDSKTYRLQRYHFHTPSEHLVNGISAPMEIHFVHRADDGSFAVIGVLVETGASLGKMEALLKTLPARPGNERSFKQVRLDANDWLPGNRRYYRYDGSLTTPPCSEGLKWFVLKTPIRASARQVARFQRVMGKNNRPAQPLGGRELLEDSSE